MGHDLNIFADDGPTSEREALEFEVAQLADGTLDPSREADVRRAIAADETLESLYGEFVSLERLLLREPPAAELDRACAAVADRVMTTIRHDALDDADELTDAPTRSQGFWRRWGITAAAAAAALALGLSFNLLMTGSIDDPGRSTDVAVEQAPEIDDNGSDGEAVLEVTVPAFAAATPVEDGGLFTTAQPGGNVVVSVTDGALNPFAPESLPTGPAGNGEIVTSNAPDFVGLYNAAGVVDRPSRVSIASGEFGE